MYPSLKDVAARAGVSFQTAGKVLNGRLDVVSAATRRRIEDAARDLGYVPNALARGLVRQASLTLGILCDDLSDPALSGFVVAAQRRIEAAGHAALLAGVGGGAGPGTGGGIGGGIGGGARAGTGAGLGVDADPRPALRRLREHRVAGLLVVAPSLEHDERVADALDPEVPTVSLNHLPGVDIPLVGSDHARTGALAAAHLLTLGHTRIASVTGPTTRRVVRSRHAGFQQEVDRVGAGVAKPRTVATDWTPRGAYTATHALFERPGVVPVTALFVQNDLMALGALAALRERGIAVPQQCSVMGCDDLPLAAFAAPALTTVRIPFRDTGSRAVELLLDRIRGEQVPARTVLPVELVVRSSTAPVPAPVPRRTS